MQRALETGCEALLVAKNGTDGVYNKDPNQHADALKYDRLSYDEVISQDLKVMDQSAFILARDHALPLHVFDITEKGALVAICQGKSVGTKIGPASAANPR